MRRWGRFAVAYAGMALVAVLIAMATRGRPPVSLEDPWLPLGSPRDLLYSVALGTTLGTLLAVGTRYSVPRFAWAKNLHLELRPFARDVSTPGIVMLAITSSLGEELLFRGLLQPWLGLWLQALLFGVLHQMAGPSRWVWASWATLVGLLFGGIFALTGSLAGPIAAHALVNGLNLSYLKNHDPGPRRGLGGLLAERG
ncbi:MAG TPA: type II CAAX endopeptidase family protein [Polyangiaceae bacterium]